MKKNFNIEARAEHVFADEIVSACFFDRTFESLRALGEFAANIDISGVHVKGEAGDKNAFDNLVRIFVNDVAIFKSPGL